MSKVLLQYDNARSHTHRRIKRSRGLGQIRVNAKTTNSDLGRSRKSLGATDLVDLNGGRHNKLLPSGNKMSLK